MLKKILEMAWAGFTWVLIYVGSVVLTFVVIGFLGYSLWLYPKWIPVLAWIAFNWIHPRCCDTFVLYVNAILIAGLVCYVIYAYATRLYLLFG